MLPRKILTLLCALAAGIPAVAAQEAGPPADTGKGSGLALELDLYMDAFKVNRRTFAHTDIRVQAAQDTTAIQLPFSGMDFWSDSEATLGYEGKYFGGNFSLSQGSVANTGFGALRGWARLGVFRVTIGNDIESTYADALDADPGLRIYTGSEVVAPVPGSKDKNRKISFVSQNPDNITGSEGFLLEALLKNLTIGLAAGEFSSIPNLSSFATGTNTYGERYDASFRYGARVGYNLEDVGKFNVSYIIKGSTIADSFGFKPGTTEIVPTKPIAESYIHLFGLYGSLKLPGNLGLTIGYNGELTSYLDEFYNGAMGLVKTGYPLIFKNGVNLNVRYKTGGLTLRTDNTVSFWSDKNYDAFEANDQRLVDVGLKEREQADRYAQVNHFMMWNGIGASVDLMQKKYTASLYVRNMLAQYEASGATPAGKGAYTLFRDQIALELEFLYRINAKAEMFVKLTATDLITVRSKDLNAQSSGIFIDYINNNSTQGKKPTPVETLDNELTFSIPIGVTLKFQ
jgi:hypothetical protein